MVQELRNHPKQRELLAEFREPLWRMLQECLKECDADMAYSVSQELSRVEADEEKLAIMRGNLQRHFAQEVRWHDPHQPLNQEEFVRERLGLQTDRPAPYPTKRWYYMYAMPMLLENGSNVEKLLEDYTPHALEPHERKAHRWARTAVRCMQALVPN